MKPWLTLITVLFACAITAAQTESKPAKKLLAFGWDRPTPAWLRQNANTAESRGFDAMAIRVPGTQNVFNRTPYPESAYQQAIQDLNASQSKLLRHSFLEIQATLGKDGGANPDRVFDWFDDAHWASAERHVRLSARIVKQTGLRGVFFDNEPYSGTRPWGFEQQPNRGARTFEAYQQQLRKRGAQFMRSLEAEAPGLTVFTTRLLSTSYREWRNGQRFEEIRAGLPKDAYYGLWLSFAEGMLEAASDRVTFIEGAEDTYHIYTAEQFDQVRRWVLEDLPRHLSPEVRPKYARQVKMSAAVFVDGVMNDLQDTRFLGYYFKPDERLKLLEHNTFHALRISDEYAWVYAERSKWWTEPPLVPEHTTIQRARAKTSAGQALGFDSAFAQAAGKRFDARVHFAGFIRDAAGQGVENVEIVSSAPDIRCSTTDKKGLYTCVSVPGWSGVLTPKLAGKTFTPNNRTYNQVTVGQFGQGYRAD